MTILSPRPLLFIALLLLAALPFHAAAGPIVLLDAHFDDKTPDAPIGTGGAALGEPTFVHPVLDAVVRAEPGSGTNQELELAAGPGTSTLSTRFELLDSVEIMEGMLHIEVEFILGTSETFRSVHLYIREQGGSAVSFANLTLRDNGTLALSGDGIAPQSWPGLVQFEARNEIELMFDMDQGRYWFWFNGADLAPSDGYAHGISERGIGRLSASLAASSDDPRSARMDGLLVTWLPGDAVFADGFELPAPMRD